MDPLFARGFKPAEIVNLRLVHAKRQFPSSETAFSVVTHCGNYRLVEARRQFLHFMMFGRVSLTSFTFLRNLRRVDAKWLRSMVHSCCFAWVSLLEALAMKWSQLTMGVQGSSEPSGARLCCRICSQSLANRAVEAAEAAAELAAAAAEAAGEPAAARAVAENA